MPIEVERYRRTYHDSSETDRSLAVLPGWMEWREHGSVGYQFINATFGNQMEYLVESVYGTRDNYFPQKAYLNEPHLIYKTQHDTSSGNIPINQSITVELYAGDGTTHVTSSGDVTTINPINTESEEEFFIAPPNRITYNDSDRVTPSGLGGSITGLTYVRDWKKVDASGVTLIPKQNVYIVNQNLHSPVENSVKSTVVYNTDWEILDSIDYGSGSVTYSDMGYYEVIPNPSGTYQLDHIPVAGTLKVFDYVNLDSEGNAQELPSANYTLTESLDDYQTTATISMSGVNPWNNVDVKNSNYFVEYKWKKFDYPKCLTTQDTRWHIQRQASPPVFTSSPSYYHGTRIPFQRAISPSGFDFALRVDSRDIRPGAVASIEFNYVMYEDESWDNTSTYTNNLAEDPYFINTASGGVHVYKEREDVTRYWSPRLPFSGTVSIGPTGDLPFDAPVTVRSYYNARKTYEVTAVQSFSDDRDGVDPYPLDYTIEGGYLVPCSILPIEDSNTTIRNLLLSSYDNQFKVTSNLDFTGIAYDWHKDCYWMLENNNVSLYKIRPADGEILGKYNIFKPPNYYFTDSWKAVASGVTDARMWTTEEYPFLSMGKDVSDRSVEACVYFKDRLYVASCSTSGVAMYGGINYGIGGSGIWILDTYDERNMDFSYDLTTHPVERHPHFPLPSSFNPGTGVSGTGIIVDMTVNEDEDLLIATSGSIAKFGLHYDYVLIDSAEGITKGTVYYRENYQNGADVGPFKEWQE